MYKSHALALAVIIGSVSGISEARDSNDSRELPLLAYEGAYFAPGVVVATKPDGGTRRYAFGKEGMKADIAFFKGREALLRNSGYPQRDIDRVLDHVAFLEGKIAENDSAAKVTYADSSMCFHDIEMEATNSNALSYWSVRASSEHDASLLPGPPPPYVPVARMFAEAYAIVSGSIPPNNYASDTIDLDYSQNGSARVGIRVLYGSTCTTHAIASVTMLSPPAGCTGVEAYKSIVDTDTCGPW